MRRNKRHYLMIACMVPLILSCSSFAETVLWTQDWENGWGPDWHVTNGTWDVGTPTYGPSGPWAGSSCVGTNLHGNYNDDNQSSLVRHTTFVVPPADQFPRIIFYQWLNFNTSDGGSFQIRDVNGGDWQWLTSQYGEGSNCWARRCVYLNDYAGLEVEIAFYFYSSNFSGGYVDVDPGWYIDDVSLVVDPPVMDPAESWEQGWEEWWATNANWEVGAPTSGPGYAYDGDNVICTRLDGNYDDDAESILISPAFEVPPASQNPRFTFWQYFAYNTSDYMQVVVRPVGTPDWDYLAYQSQLGSGVWSYFSQDLREYAGETLEIGLLHHTVNFSGGYTDVSSGWYIDRPEVKTGPYQVHSPEGFEQGFGDWSAIGANWEVGAPTYGPDGAYEGENCVATNLHANYWDGADAWLISPPLNVVGQSASISFYHWFSFNSSDWGRVEVKVPGEDWVVISNTFSGNSSNTWSPPWIDLSAYSGLEIQIGFHFHSFNFSGGYVDVSSGWYVDAVTFTGIGTVSNLTVVSPNGGESWHTATPHDILWDSNLGGNVRIELYDGNAVELLIAEAVPNSGSYTWDIPENLPPGHTYRVRVSSIDQVYEDFSDAFFSIVSLPTISLIPYDPPVIIPAYGGGYWFWIEVMNPAPVPGTGQGWTELILPNGSTYGPLMVVTLTVPGDGVLAPPVPYGQWIPDYAPAGTYQHVMHIGLYPNLIVDSASFEFEKLPDSATAGIPQSEWSLDDWHEISWNPQIEDVKPAVPESFTVSRVYPNPFNERATVQVALPDAGELTVALYNVTGQQVATLAQGQHTAGTHTFSLDASGLASGVYFIRASLPGERTLVRKVMLVR